EERAWIEHERGVNALVPQGPMKGPVGSRAEADEHEAPRYAVRLHHVDGGLHLIDELGDVELRDVREARVVAVGVAEPLEVQSQRGPSPGSPAARALHPHAVRT